MEETKKTGTTEQAIKVIAIASDVALKKLAVATEKASKKLLKDAEDVASHLRSSAAIVNEAATKLLATQAEAAVKVVNTKGSDDHDLLIELRTLMTVMQGSVSKIETGTTAQITDHERRIKDLEEYKRVIDLEKGGLLQVWTNRFLWVTLGIIATMLISHLFGIKIL